MSNPSGAHAIGQMHTMVNGQPAEWSEEILAKWTAVWTSTGETRPFDTGAVSLCNYFTPRPYVDEYNRGSDREGFTYTLEPGHHVCQVQWMKGTQ